MIPKNEMAAYMAAGVFVCTLQFPIMGLCASHSLLQFGFGLVFY